MIFEDTEARDGGDGMALIVDETVEEIERIIGAFETSVVNSFRGVGGGSEGFEGGGVDRKVYYRDRSR